MMKHAAVIQCTKRSNGLNRTIVRPERPLFSRTMPRIRFDPETETFNSFDLSDGLQSNMFHAGAFGKRKNGAMLFGGINGLNYLHPDSLQSNAFVPPVVITAFKKDGSGGEIIRDVSAIKELVLSYQENFFSFEFAALNFIQPEKNQYAYKLEGWDRTFAQMWHGWFQPEIERRREAGLLPDNFTLLAAQLLHVSDQFIAQCHFVRGQLRCWSAKAPARHSNHNKPTCHEEEADAGPNNNPNRAKYG
jgi:hypothetical protein